MQGKAFKCTKKGCKGMHAALMTVSDMKNYRDYVLDCPECASPMLSTELKEDEIKQKLEELEEEKSPGVSS